ncbi:MAG: hypothetical protein EDM79_16915 [Chloroflexi bacterium]|nr:MAG: hypothetical protein EDM79_16915 [Chloroflexota bacterium]
MFCGAGISKPAGLPLFDELVSLIYKALGDSPTDLEQGELNKDNYDRVLNLIESRFGGKLVRQKVKEIHTPCSNPFLDTHHSILALAREKSGHIHLVTTNFDLLFEMADSQVPKTGAPLLPVPKPTKWNQLVYLHGRLGDEIEEQHLVLTSGDFGIA